MVRSKKISKELKYLYQLNKKFIENLYKKLNLVNKTTHSKQFWYMLISPWSLPFIQIAFDRWNSINSIIRQNRNKKFLTLVIDYNQKAKDKLTPISTEEFFEFFKNDYWNQYISQEIAKNYKNILFIKEIKKFKNSYLKQKYRKNLSLKSFFLKFLRKLFKIFNYKKNKYFIYKTYLGMWREFLLCVKLGQLPYYDEIKFKIKRRKKIKILEIR